MKSPKTQKVDNSGAEAAARATAEAQTVANNLQRNFATDLRSENLANIDAGGDAAAATGTGTETSRRKKAGGGLASQLGISI